MRGLEHVPQDGGFVLSANQLSNLDGFALAYALHPRQVRWMGKAELFHPATAPLLRRLGIFPVRRGEGDRAALEAAIDMARAGHVVGIFPEGTRRTRGRIPRQGRPHSGAARVALAAEVPLVPAALVGTERLGRLRAWRLAFGSAVPVDGLDKHPRLAAREATSRLWGSVTSLETELQAESGRPPRRLRPRLRLDVSLSDLLYALASCAGAWGAREARVLDLWEGRREGMVCVSVRSGFELLLQALSLSPGSEIAFSAVTHPDMPRLARAHGLRPLPVDVDAQTLAPRPEALERALTPSTRVLVVAHLFGGRVALETLAEIARSRNVLLVEDCAQSFRGPQAGGDPLADVSLFSFGPIKTATALGGALVRVRDAGLLERMRRIQETWPVQGRGAYAGRVAKVAALLVVGRPRVYWLFARTVDALGRTLDEVTLRAVRGFSGGDISTLARRRASAPLMAMLERRLRRFDHGRLEARANLGTRLSAALPSSLLRPGAAALDHTHWLVPVVAPDPAAMIAALRRAGFDAASATSNISIVLPPEDRPDLTARTAAQTMQRVVYLPVDPGLSERDLERLVAAVGEVDGSVL